MIRSSLILFLALFSTMAYANQTEKAVFAAGCFWCVESDFKGHDGVINAISGYAGGHVKNPTYEQVTKGGTGHLEVVQVEYDPARISYERLLEIFWANVDPLNTQGQFCDLGESYKSAIFYADADQKAKAEKSIAHVTDKIGQPVVTELKKLDTFYPAEDYHQDFARKNEYRYTIYRNGCGRDQRLKELWADEAGKSISIFPVE